MKTKSKHQVSSFLRCNHVSILVWLFLIIPFLGMSATYQIPKISLEAKEASPKQVFDKIRQETKFNFFYQEDDIDHSESLTLKVRNENLTSVLDKIFDGSDLSYEIVNNQILIKKMASSILLSSAVPMVEMSTPIVIEDKSITGYIRDGDGEPLIGATVVVKGTDNGTQTDIDGYFELTVPEGLVTLVISYIGYQTQEYDVTDQTEVNITLKDNTAVLDEVVVIGYGTDSKKLQTSSVESIKADDIQEIPSAQISNSLAGRFPGAQTIQNTGFTGGSSSIRIRGAGVDPLFVIDNVISDKAQFDILDPSEVESVTILKDAATASIYGSRASGGVVLVKTKLGTFNQKIQARYSGIFTTNRTTKPLQNWSPEEELIHRNNAGIHNNRESSNPDPNYVAPFGEDALSFARNSINYRNVNDEVWRNPQSQQHSLSVSGGSENTKYFFGTNFNQNLGSYDNVQFDKYTVRSNVEVDITDNFKIGTNLSYNRRVTDRFYWPYDNDNGEGFTLADFYRPTFNLSRLYPFYATADGQATSSDDPGAYPVVQPYWGFNPVEIIRSTNYRNINYNTFNGILTGEWDLPWVKGLQLSFLGNYRQNNKFQKDFVGEYNQSYRVQTVSSSGIGLIQLAPIDFNNIVTNNLRWDYPGIAENFTNSESYQLNGFINYANSFGVSDIDAFVGVEQYQFKQAYGAGRALKSITNQNDQILSTSSSTDDRYFSGNEDLGARLSYFGRAKYVYANKYIGEFSFRYDGSYIFPENKRFGFFPSISGAWRISEEEFFTSNFFDELKIKASYGETGSDNINPFQYQNNYVVNGNYVFENGTTNGLSPQSSIANPDITWSELRTFNFGIDASMLDNHLNSSVSYYTSTESDILAPPTSTIPGTFGTNLSYTNAGERKLHGFEFSLDYSNTAGELGYTLGANMGYAIDKWTKWPEREGIQDFQSRIGKPSGFLTGYLSNGIVRSQADLENLPSDFTEFGRPLQLGEILYEDIRGDGFSEGSDGKIDANDQTVISLNSIPRINYGAFMNFDWKRFSLDAFFQGVAKYDKIVSTINTRGGGVFQLGDRPYFQLWTDAYSDTNTDGQYPRVQGWGQIENGYGPSTFWIRNGAYFRLKNLNIGYKIPVSVSERIGMDQFKLYFNATNLFVISAFKEYDPEQSSLDSYPLFKSYSFGLNLTF